MKASNTYVAVFGTLAVAAGVYLFLRTKNNQTQERPTMNNNNLNSNLPRGYRNNNPLNIRLNSSNSWQGKVYPNTDGVFEQFKSMAYGYRAALQLIRKYISSGYNTVSSIISRWAPATENNTQRYIERVCRTTGFTPGTIIGAYNKEQMCSLVYAMAIVENGNVQGHPDMQTIYQGYNLL